MMNHNNLPILTPPYPHAQICTNPEDAIKALESLYQISTRFLFERFQQVIAGNAPEARFRAYYPRLHLNISSHANIDSRLAYGRVPGPGTYATTLTRPDLFRDYLQAQIEILMKNYGGPITVDISETCIPLHFALPEGMHVEGTLQNNLSRPLRDIFDTPDLAQTDDRIVNGEFGNRADDLQPLAPFTAPRIDYSLHRLAHYTATRPRYFQNFVLFTNYQFYVDEFVRYAKETLNKENSGYTALIEPGNIITNAASEGEQQNSEPSPTSPQMPAYHLIRPDHSGITLVNIGVGPSNAKTITDHIAVLRPHTWLMLGHCAGLRKGQSLGDYVLAHAYLREDHVLDEDLPIWVPIPPLAEVQVAMEEAVAEITELSGYELKRLMRTGTVATIDNRNWELRDQSGPIKRLSQSRAIGLDMESATIAANGFRFRVPYGTLLCVSDKPLHGELKLPGMATEFYTRQVAQHLQIGIRALEKLREMPPERLHSRKLRAFDETAFQ